MAFHSFDDGVDVSFRFGVGRKTVIPREEGGLAVVEIGVLVVGPRGAGSGGGSSVIFVAVMIMIFEVSGAVVALLTCCGTVEVAQVSILSLVLGAVGVGLIDAETE